MKNHRLHALCPYFAMFPPSFVRENLLAHTKPGDVVLDGFSGRGTTLLESLLNDRDAIACDINPVAYCISAAKAKPFRLTRLLREIDSLETAYKRSSHSGLEKQRRELTQFFRRAFYAETLRQIVFLRARLNWRGNLLHRFLSALILGHLHGEMNRSQNYLSNQMPHSISPKPEYSLKYWHERNLWSPRRDVFSLLRQRAEYRLSEGFASRKSRAALCDVRQIAKRFKSYANRVEIVITSPPYLDVTNFEEDQWLRLWFLGGRPYPTYNLVSSDDRHTSTKEYWEFLAAAWLGIRPLLKPAAKVICRIGAKGLDPNEITTRMTESLRRVWPKIGLLTDPVCTVLPSSQAKTLLPQSVGCKFELDLSYALPSH